MTVWEDAGRVHDICQRAVGAVGEVVEMHVAHALVEDVRFEGVHVGEDEAAAADAVGLGVVPEGGLSVMMMMLRDDDDDDDGNNNDDHADDVFFFGC